MVCNWYNVVSRNATIFLNLSSPLHPQIPSMIYGTQCLIMFPQGMASIYTWPQDLWPVHFIWPLYLHFSPFPDCYCLVLLLTTQCIFLSFFYSQYKIQSVPSFLSEFACLCLAEVPTFLLLLEKHNIVLCIRYGLCTTWNPLDNFFSSS